MADPIKARRMKPATSVNRKVKMVMPKPPKLTSAQIASDFAKMRRTKNVNNGTAGTSGSRGGKMK